MRDWQNRFLRVRRVKPDRSQKDKGYQSLPANFATEGAVASPSMPRRKARAAILHRQAAFDFDDKLSEIG
jgi:hypothetical protein